MSEAEKIAVSLIGMERERLTGWQGPGGAAYNCISEDLCEQGLLNADWSLSPLGLEVRAILQRFPTTESESLTEQARNI